MHTVEYLNRESSQSSTPRDKYFYILKVFVLFVFIIFNPVTLFRSPL